jgi:2-haloacid dehalogenase
VKEKAPDFPSVPCSRFDRRGFLRLAAGSLFATPLSAISPNLTLPAQVRPKAIAFDALAVFDPRSILKSTSQLFPKEGAELSREWRVSQFEYSWLRNSMNRYADFWQVTHEALTNAANKVNVHLTEVHQSQLMGKFRQLEPWPDAGPVLLQLRNAGIRVCILSDFTESMLGSCVEHAGLNGIFEHLLSCDRVREFKPSPRAYQMGVDAFRLNREEILFVAFAGWDAIGAKSFGYPSYWANRMMAPPEQLGAIPDYVSANLQDVVPYISGQRNRPFE